jgi:hypothetical protein
MKATILVSTLCLGLVLSGCTTQSPAPTNSSHPTSHATATTFAQGPGANQSFDGASIPTGWVAHKGNWTTKAGTGGHEKVLEGKGDADPGLSSLVDHADGEYSDFTLEVDFMMISGEHPQGAGVVFDWKDDKNYQIVRYSISEQGWHIFTVVNGNRNKQDEATLENTTAPQFGQWVHLKVVQQGNEVNVYDGATRVLEYFLKDQDSKSGFIGVFCRGDTLAQFDNFRIKP